MYLHSKSWKYSAQISAGLLLAAFASMVNAQWKFIAVEPVYETRFFLDTSRIYHDDERIWVWFLMDYKEPQTSDHGPYQSSELMEAINCGNRETTWFNYIYYAEAGGRGAVIDSDSFSGRGPIQVEPGTFMEILITAACDEFVRTYKPKTIKPASLRLELIQSFVDL
jgi:hypothetical protein